MATGDRCGQLTAVAVTDLLFQDAPPPAQRLVYLWIDMADESAPSRIGGADVRCQLARAHLSLAAGAELGNFTLKKDSSRLVHGSSALSTRMRELGIWNPEPADHCQSTWTRRPVR